MKVHSSLPATLGENRNLWSPFDMLQDQVDRLFDDFSRGMRLPDMLRGEEFGLNPLIDVDESDTQILINCELPGVDEKDIDISVNDQILTISGEKKSEFERKEGGRFRTERSYGKFSRAMSLPFSVDPNKVEAKFDRGVLKLTIQKPAEARMSAHKIPIKH